MDFSQCGAQESIRSGKGVVHRSDGLILIVMRAWSKKSWAAAGAYMCNSEVKRAWPTGGKGVVRKSAGVTSNKDVRDCGT